MWALLFFKTKSLVRDATIVHLLYLRAVTKACYSAHESQLLASWRMCCYNLVFNDEMDRKISRKRKGYKKLEILSRTRQTRVNHGADDGCSFRGKVQIVSSKDE